MTDIDDLLPCPDCGGQGINTDTLGTKTAVCRKCKGSGRTRAAIAAMPGGGPGAWVPADHLAEANREIARMREVLGMIEAIGDGSKTANSLTNIADIARAAIKDTQP